MGGRRGDDTGVGRTARLPFAPQALPVMFTLLLKTPHGWTDTFGHGVDVDANQWPTEEAALDAAQALREVGIGDAPDSEWRVIPLEDLDSYNLIA